MQKPLINFFIIFICITLSLDSFGQSDQEILLKDSSSDQIEFVLEKPDRKFIQKINPFYWAYTGMTNFYQRNISVQIAANCIFEETCSRFSRKLVDEKGIFAGIVLSLDRISRCNKVTLAETSPLRFTKDSKITENIDEYNF